MLDVRFHDILLSPRPDRVLARQFIPEGGRLEDLISRVSELSEQDAVAAVASARALSEPRHRDVSAIWAGNAAAVPVDVSHLSPAHLELLGALLTCEYAIEGAALTNPSAVPLRHRPDGGVDFVMSARAIGEGHVSSLVFATGSAFPDPTSGELRVSLEERPRYVSAGVCSDVGDGYKVTFRGVPLPERVIFPHAAAEANGIEDARFVAFTERVTPRFAATYTAYDGHRISGRLLTTDDFCTFFSIPLTGPGAANKGVALFPRRITGSWLAVTRTDGVSMGLAESDNLYHWGEPAPLYTPRLPWEIYQGGNCGSPIETPQGWLLITHGVGPMRHYSIGAILLERDDPSKVRAILRSPLIFPHPGQRDGYVPNVVYTCGVLEVGGQLLIPYGLADCRIGFASVAIADLLSEMG